MKKTHSRLSMGLLAGASLLTLVACQSTQMSETTDVSEPTEVAEVTETTEVTEPTEVTEVTETIEETEDTVRRLDNLLFLDASTFDSQLSSSLSDQTQAVKVNIPAKFSLNDIPERMNVWLQRIQESGGTVNAQAIPDPNSQTRGLISALIAITIELVSYARKEAMYKPADDYDVTLMYDEETGEVKEVIFQQR